VSEAEAVGAERTGSRIAVVIPCFQVAQTIRSVLSEIGDEVAKIYCVDDGSTDDTASLINDFARRDPRVCLVRRKTNGGVGAATMDGYRAALADGATIIVKLDGDGQMPGSMIPGLIGPLLDGDADYVKGNRFYTLELVRRMPRLRLWGNAGLSFLTKLSTGYWQLFDPNNGFTAIHANVASALPLAKIHSRYFFEADMLFRLNTLRARVVEMPMPAQYENEQSHLNVLHAFLTFPLLHARNVGKRILYNYFLRNFSIASLNLIVGAVLIVAGATFGAVKWIQSYRQGIPATAGTVMLSGLPVLVGVQLVLSFLAYDMAMLPDRPVHPYLQPPDGERALIATDERKRY